MDTVGIRSLLLAMASAASIGCARARPASVVMRGETSPWTVVAIRQPTRDDIPFETSSGYLRLSEDLNNVPGPDSLVAHARTDEQHRTYLEVEDRRTHAVVRLLDRGGSLPQWSPDGSFISCVVWKSTRQPHELTVVDVKERRVLLDPDISASGTAMKWSPDSRTLAAAGVVYGQPRSILYSISIPDGTVRILDSLDVLSDYEFSWSPDSRWIAFSRPTKLDEVSEDPTAADMWIADASTGEKWSVLASLDWVESNPLWITDRSIQVERAPAANVDEGVISRMVVDLRLAKSRASP